MKKVLWKIDVNSVKMTKASKLKCHLKYENPGKIVTEIFQDIPVEIRAIGG
jgi:hypothetical protein